MAKSVGFNIKLSVDGKELSMLCVSNLDSEDVISILL